MDCICGSECFDFNGPPKSETVLVYNQPLRSNAYEIRVKNAIAMELNKCGINLNSCRHVYLYPHNNPADDCIRYNMFRINDELKKCPGHILMFGGELSARYADEPDVINVCGLEIEVPMLGRSVSFAPTMESLLSGGIGEMRLSIEKYAKRRNTKA